MRSLTFTQPTRGKEVVVDVLNMDEYETVTNRGGNVLVELGNYRLLEGYDKNLKEQYLVINDYSSDTLKLNLWHFYTLMTLFVTNDHVSLIEELDSLFLSAK